MATGTKGRKKVWNKQNTIQAGIDHIKTYGELPSATTWRFTDEGRPTTTTVINLYKDADGKHGWSRFIKSLKTAYKKQTGETAPEQVKGGSGKKGVSRYDGRPGMRPANPRSDKWNDETPEPVVVSIPMPEVPQVTPEPVPAKKGFWARLFG